MPPSEWPGHYFDGQTAARHDVTVVIGREGLLLHRPDGVVVSWPFWQIRVASQNGAGLKLETKEQLPQSLTVADPSFAATLRPLFPALFEAEVGKEFAWKAGLILAAFGLLVIGGIYLSLPLLGRAIAAMIPRSWEEKLGEAVVGSLAPEGKRCKDSNVVDRVRQVVQALDKGSPSPYRFQVYVVDDSDVNAFAAPGGHVVVFRGLIDKTKSAEELAGVLSHEMQHVIQRHGTRAMLRGLSIRMMLAMVLGDVSWMYELAGALGELHFMRGDEESADVEGMRMMERARLDPQGMVRLMQTLDKESAGLPGPVRYLSTHPQTGERVEAMKRMAAAMRYTPRALLPGVQWPPITSACRAN